MQISFEIDDHITKARFVWEYYIVNDKCHDPFLSFNNLIIILRNGIDHDDGFIMGIENQLSNGKRSFEVVADSFPKYIMYDVTNVCNAACLHCAHPIVKSEIEYQAAFFDVDLFTKTLEEAARYDVELIRITADGEPLMHPEIATLVFNAKNATGATINITTNGSLIKGRLLEKLLMVPPDVFDISLDAHYPETYSKVRKGLDFSTVKNNILELCRMRDPAQTKIIVSMIHRPELQDEMLKFQDYWGERVDKAVVRKMHGNGGLSGRVVVPPGVSRWPCQHLWGRLIIDYDARIRYCPVDWRGESILGRVGQVTLKEVWDGKPLRTLRNQHLSGDFTGRDCCHRCTDWYTSPWDKGWLKMIEGMYDADAAPGQHD